MMKTALLFLISWTLLATPFVLQAQPDNSKTHYEQSFAELQSMLEGQTETSFERAVYLSEAPYWQQSYSYADFQTWVDQQLVFVSMLSEKADGSDSVEFEAKVNKDGIFAIDKLRYTPQEKEKLYNQTLNNWAIFTWLTDTVDLGFLRHYPFSYASNDPFGREQWAHSQVVNLLAKGKPGNCYALTALYKILADRLDTDAELCTAPQHIYIRHRDTEGRAYNVELATAGFPTDGQLQTLTHTPSQAIRNGIALRSYTAQQSIGLCLVNLAKAYEHQFDTKTDDFIMRCAALALKHDPKNLNALLLKQQVLDERLQAAMTKAGLTAFAQAKNSNAQSALASELEAHVAELNALGYLPMPVEMQRIILQGLESPEDVAYYKQDKNPSPFTTITPLEKEDGEYLSLSDGLFQEVFDPTASATYGHFTFDPVQQAVTTYHAESHQYELIDPVAFAYNFGARMYDARLGRWLSRDPLADNYVPISPYAFALNNPIFFVDHDGREIVDHEGNRVTWDENSDGTLTFSANASSVTKLFVTTMLRTPESTAVLQLVDDLAVKVEIIEMSSEYNGLSDSRAVTRSKEHYQAVDQMAKNDFDPESVENFNSLPDEFILNQKTGYDNRSSTLSTLVISVYLPNEMTGEDNIAYNFGVLNGMSETSTRNLVEVFTEEAVHTTQSEFRFYEVESNSSGDYEYKTDANGDPISIPYEQRSHEIEAKKIAEKAATSLE